MVQGLLLAGLSGYIALSYEILWYRALSVATNGTADTFGLMLGAYLVGLSLGAVAARRLCRESTPAERVARLKTLFTLSLLGNLAGFFLVPVTAWMLTKDLSWKWSLPLVGVSAASMGALFPLVAHHWIAPDEKVGSSVSYLYLANILGSTGGSLVTGLVAAEGLGIKAGHQLLFILGMGMAGLILGLLPNGERWRPGILVVALATVAGFFGQVPFDGVYEKLQYRWTYRPGIRFSHVVETKSGVITVAPNGQVFGGGIYEGTFSTSLHDDKNSILRCYALAEIHREPKDVLMIGLATGSWATVLANNPGVERLTIVEINPGYLQLIPKYAAVSGLLSHPKVRIEIDDGRRWLVRNGGLKFDLIVANTTFHWRANATNLLSREFLQLVRARLNAGGVYYFNTTGGIRTEKTACEEFPHALMVMNCLAVSDSPLSLEPERLRDRLFQYPWEGSTALAREVPGDVAQMDRLIGALRGKVLSRERIVARHPPHLKAITDDNMGTEWDAFH